MPEPRASLEALITVPPATAPVRVALRRSLTTIGSVAGADVRLAGVPPHWVVLQRDEEASVTVCVLSTGARHRIGEGESVVVDGATVLLGRADPRDDGPIPVGQIADALASVESPGEVLRLLLERVMQIVDADSGAVIVKEAGSYSVAVARDRYGAQLPHGEALLSDTIVRDVLERGAAVREGDLHLHERYRNVPSVVNSSLRSVLAVPMVIGDRVMGALYLGRSDPTTGPARGFAQRRADDIAVVASMAIPFLAQLRRAGPAPGADGLIGDAPALQQARALIEKVAPSDLSVLVTGETGTGKEVAARAIHALSGRAQRPMIALNCSSVPAGLLEAELFGYVKGAFTGAVAAREGKIEAAHGSTLFLDEVGDMPLPMQASLLRVLQEREVTRVGENQPRAVDIRLIAATHRDLDAEVAAGRFRDDLLFRLREIEIPLPRLRDRGDDIALLARLFLRQAERQLGLAAHDIAADADAVLRAHTWPGNARELRAAMRRAAVLCDGPSIDVPHLGLPGNATAARGSGAGDGLGDLDRPLADARDAFVARYVAAVVERHGGNREAAAAALGISLRSLYRHQ